MKEEYVSLSTTTEADFVKIARNVYAHLDDEISKKIFEAKCLFALTGNVGAMTGLDSKYRNLNSDIENYAKNIKKGDHCFVFGTGGGAHYLAGRFRYFGVHIDAFIETDEAKGNIDEKTGIKIIHVNEMLQDKARFADKKYVISYSNPQIAGDAKRFLCDEIGVLESFISMRLYDWRNNCSQYFDYFEPKDNEVFVDCGCFDGGTCFRFAGWCGIKGYEQIYSFEADPKNYVNCKRLLEPLGKCELFPYGTAQKNEKVYFASKAFEDSCIISEEEAKRIDFKGVETIETVALDDVLKGKRITFLKMDVEGAEYEALLGAETLIKENHPRMAISIYHKPEDFVTIPNLILSMNPEYKISFRHYGLDDLETILYVE